MKHRDPYDTLSDRLFPWVMCAAALWMLFTIAYTVCLGLKGI